MLRIVTIALFGVAVLTAAAVSWLQFEERPAVPRVAVDPPTLWRAEAQGAAMDVCANSAVRDAFTRPEPHVNGELCQTVGRAVDRPGLYAARCVAFGRRYSVNATTSGDSDRDFTVAFAVRPLEVDYPGARQVTRYRKLGPCPAGSKIGDTVPPGAARSRNALS